MVKYSVLFSKAGKPQYIPDNVHSQIPNTFFVSSEESMSSIKEEKEGREFYGMNLTAFWPDSIECSPKEEEDVDLSL